MKHIKDIQRKIEILEEVRRLLSSFKDMEISIKTTIRYTKEIQHQLFELGVELKNLFKTYEYNEILFYSNMIFELSNTFSLRSQKMFDNDERLLLLMQTKNFTEIMDQYLEAEIEAYRNI